ncbi:MAG: hypothetical protein ACT4N4_09060 [Rhodospirillales bacterium]
MRSSLLVGLCAALSLLAVPGWAEPVKYKWHGYGINVPGSSRCPSYEMDIFVNVEGGRVWGHWQQRTRVVRQFDFPLGPDGSFGGKVDLGASVMTVSGRAAADGARFDMKGYCIFGGTLTKE